MFVDFQKGNNLENSRNFDFEHQRIPSSQNEYG